MFVDPISLYHRCVTNCSFKSDQSKEFVTFTKAYVYIPDPHAVKVLFVFFVSLVLCQSWTFFNKPKSKFASKNNDCRDKCHQSEIHSLTLTSFMFLPSLHMLSSWKGKMTTLWMVTNKISKKSFSQCYKRSFVLKRKN